MIVPVKVIVQIRRTGTNATNLRTILDNNRTVLTSDCTAALLGMETSPTFSWSMRVNARGNSVYHLYPKVEVDCPNATTYDTLWPRMRAIRNAVVSRMQTIASSSGWTIQATHTKSYGGS